MTTKPAPTDVFDFHLGTCECGQLTYTHAPMLRPEIVRSDGKCCGVTEETFGMGSQSGHLRPHRFDHAREPGSVRCHECICKSEGRPMKKSEKNKNKSKGNGAAAKPFQPKLPAVASGPVERKRFHQELPCRIDEAAGHELGAQLAKVVDERLALVEEKSSALIEFRKRKEYYDKREQELAAAVNSLAVMKSIECIEYLLPTNEIQVVRTDTGEVLEVRAARATELQEPLTFKDGKDPPEPPFGGAEASP